MLRNYAKRVLEHLTAIYDTETSGRMILYSPIVGAAAGLVGVAFFFLLNTTQEWVLGGMMGYYPPPAGTEHSSHMTQLPTLWWAVLLIPTVGGLLCGFVVQRFAPDASGGGVGETVEAFHQHGGKIPLVVAPIKFLASVITIGTGGSAGREGPIAQIGATIGCFIATKLGLSERERRLLLLSGAAGGIGAVFRAPLGGALFVSEVLYSTAAVEFQAFIPAIISSITAFTVFSSVHGPGLVFNTDPELAFRHAREIPLYLVLALLCSVVGHLYVNAFYGLRNHFFRKLPIPAVVKPALGGLMLGVLALWLPQVMTGGYGWIQAAIDDQISLRLLVVLCIGKIFATTFTIASGGSGGKFASTLFIGAMLGGAFAEACNWAVPGAVEHPAAFVFVGMGAFFGGVVKVPLTAMLMICEMSGSYGLLVPLMLVTIINVALLSRKWTLYPEQVSSMLDSPAHAGDFIIDVLEQLKTEQIMQKNRQIELVPQAMPLPEVLRLVSGSRNTHFPVVDHQNKMVGIFSLRDLRSALMGYASGSLILAEDLASRPVLTVTPDDDLHTALRRFTQKNIDELPVVSPEDPGIVIGMLSRKELIGAYDRQVDTLRRGEKWSSESPKRT